MVILHILGTILKIIGILLLCILFLLLLLLLVLLFVPLRYRAEISRTGGDISVQAQASYLFRLVRLPVRFENGRLTMELLVLGRPLFSNREGVKKRTGGAKRAETKTDGQPEEAKYPEQAAAVRGTEAKDESRSPAGNETEAGPQTESGQAPEQDAETDGQPGEAERETGTDNQQEETERGTGTDEPQEEAARGIFRLAGKIAGLCRRLAEKLRAFFEKIAAAAERAENALQSLTEKLKAGKAKLSDIKAKLQLILAFLRDEENKNGIKYVGKSILRLLKHVFPYKIEGDIVFATGAPYSQGQALSALGMLYPLYGKNLRITADFASDSFRLEGSVRLKGRIRLFSLLRIAWKLWREGRLKQLLLNGRELKRKLTAQA